MQIKFQEKGDNMKVPLGNVHVKAVMLKKTEIIIIQRSVLTTHAIFSQSLQQ